MSHEVTRRELIKMLSEKLIPLTMRAEPPLVLLMEPQSLRRAVPTLTIHPGTPLQIGRRMRSPYLIQRWPEQQVHASRFVCLMAVVEGEIDWRIGITAPDEELTPPPVSGQYMVVPLQQGTFFLTPAGIPYSDGQGLHWERPRPRQGQATVFWMLITPSGFMCHFCRSSATQHKSHHSFFLQCPPIFELVQMLEKELGSNEVNSDMLVKAHLQAILIYALRAAQQPVRMVPLEAGSAPGEGTNPGVQGPRNAVNRARVYIEAHFREPLTPEIVAAHAYLSARHLERYFQKELKMTITQYIVARRMDTARGLLQETDLLIRLVGEMVGYRNQSSFTQVFRRYTGMSPIECRKRKAGGSPPR